MLQSFAALAAVSVIGSASPASAMPPPVEAYGKLPGMSDVNLSPSGDRSAFVAEVDGARRLMVLASDGKPLQALNIGDKKLIDLAWAGEDYLIVHTSATVDVGPGWTVSKQELSSAIVINLKANKALQVFANHSTVESAVFGDYGVAHVGDHWFGYFGGKTLRKVWGGNADKIYANTSTDGNYMTINTDLYRVDLDTGELSIAATGDAGSAGWLVGPDGQVVARVLRNEHTGAWRVMTGARDGRQLASGTARLGGVGLLGLGRAGDSVLISHPGANGRVIDEAPLSGAAANTILDGESADRLIRDGSTGRWIGQILDGDEPSYTLFSPSFDARARAARKAFPGYVVHLKSWSGDFNRIIVLTDGNDDAGTYWLCDIAGKSAKPFGYAHPTVTTADVGPVRMIDYKAADGLALRGLLTLPPGREPRGLPVVVMPHGGPTARDYPGFNYWAQAFASRGYAVFQPNFRGSDGYGLKLRQAGDGEWGRKMQTDISDGAAEPARQGIVDPKRACIVGWSYGGYAALAGVTVQHGLYRCAVSMAGVSDLQMMYSADLEESGYADDTMRGLKAELGDRSRWRDVSPAKLAAEADAPILLIHGKDDTVVPINQSDAMERALKAAGKPVERLTLTGADHWLLKEDTRVAMLKASVAFVEKYNPPDAPQPAGAPAGH